MATCGPSNAYVDMKNHIQRDASLQRERVNGVRPVTQGFKSGSHDNSNIEFEAFRSFSNRRPDLRNDINFGYQSASDVAYPDSLDPMMLPRGVSPDVGYMGPQSTGPLTQPAYAHNAAEQRSSLGQNWTSEFQNTAANRHKVNHVGHELDQPNVPMGFMTPNFSQLGGARFTPSPIAGVSPMSMGYAQSQQSIEHSAALDAAFLEAEQSLKKLQLRETEGVVDSPVDQLKDQKDAHRQQEASDVAAKIIKTVNERSDAELSTKVMSSKFMNLMTKFKNDEVRIETSKIVDTATNTEVEPESLEPKLNEQSSHDWVPQRHGMQSEREQPPEVAPEVKRRYRFSRDLDDPDTYFRKLKSKLDPRLFTKSPYLSPLEKAQELGPSGSVNAGSWEEAYEEW